MYQLSDFIDSYRPLALAAAVFLLGFLFFLFLYEKRKKHIQKIRSMNTCQKLCALHALSEPLGFVWLPSQNIMTSTRDAWQREFGYRALYDQTAIHFHMVLDCEPVYFNYRGRTWLIEFWKGQYGICTGGEIGVYRADTLLSPSQYPRTLFQSVPDQELLHISMELLDQGRPLFSVEGVHWWLTGFAVGLYRPKENLSMRIAITFPDTQMLQSFIDSLLSMGYESTLRVRALTASFLFDVPHIAPTGHLYKCQTRWMLWQNRLCCHLYRFATRPFLCTPDRLLYVASFLPSGVQRLLRLQKNKGQKYPKGRRCR